MSVNPVSRLVELQKHGFTPRTVLDIGAYKGEWYMDARKVWPESTYFLVEANEDHKNMLELVVGKENYAIALLGETHKTRVPYYKTNIAISTGNSVYKEQTKFFSHCTPQYMNMCTLDELVHKHNLNHIDFIKIDTQGSELAIVRGGKETMRAAELVLLETQNLEYNAGAPDIFEVMAEMKKLGFGLYDITEIHYLPTGEMMQVDLMFAKQSSSLMRKGQLL